MACNTIQGVAKGCEGSNAGGIYEILVIDTSDVLSTTVNLTGHTVTAVSAATDFVKFEFNRNVGNIVPSRKIDLINGSNYYEVNVTMVLHRREASKSRALQILGEGQRFLNLIVLDANGKYWYVDHAQIVTQDGDSGTTFADGSKYTVTFKADMTNDPYEVDSTIIAGLLA